MLSGRGRKAALAALIVAGVMAASNGTSAASGVAGGGGETGNGGEAAAIDAPAVPVTAPVTDAAPGTVLSSEPIAPVESDGTFGSAGSSGSSDSLGSGGDDAEVSTTARLISFATRDEFDRPAVVGGVVVEPDVPWAHAGARPTVVVAPGTVGQADRCAPSTTFAEQPGGQMSQVEPLLEQGFRVVVSDYIGLGQPGIHTYANRLDQGRAILDAARAGLRVDGLRADSPIALWGYSQGGGATASAAELAETYAPELNVVVTFAGAPPADLSQVLTRIDGSSIMGAIGYAVNGFTERHDELRTLVDEIVSPHGKEVLAQLADDCIADSSSRVGFNRTSQWTVDGRPFSEHFAEHPEIVEFLDDQRIGRHKPNAPVLVLNGHNGDVIPFGQAEQLARDWCEQGAEVTFMPIDVPRIAPGAGIGHAAPMAVGQQLALGYLAAAFGVGLQTAADAGATSPGASSISGSSLLPGSSDNGELPGVCQF
ncbi:lipase family protein [uncultured Corynebacterium sp.]|uniref:lipase family protein n=1 Tax=uncultured Corynebacterium sp. TaxID=159447 RepID=UPI0025E5E562|nr:lipase family protein [uncultured Corynebacterium sp.]